MSPFNERQKVPLRWPGARWDVAGATQPLAHEGLTGLTGVRLSGLLPPTAGRVRLWEPLPPSAERVANEPQAKQLLLTESNG